MRLGTLAFGGPAAHIAMMEDELVSRRKWVSRQRFMDLFAAGLLLVMLVVVIVRAIQQKRRPQLSRSLLLLVTVAAGGCVLSGLHWRQSANRLEIQWFSIRSSRMLAIRTGGAGLNLPERYTAAGTRAPSTN